MRMMLRRGFQLLDTLGVWLPVLTLALLAILAVIEFLGRPPGPLQPAAAPS
jgi:hypothetical protein